VNKGRAEGVDIALAQVELLFRQHHDGTAFRRFVGEGRKLGGVSQGMFGHSGGG